MLAITTEKQRQKINQLKTTIPPTNDQNQTTKNYSLSTKVLNLFEQLAFFELDDNQTPMTNNQNAQLKEFGHGMTGDGLLYRALKNCGKIPAPLPTSDP